MSRKLPAIFFYPGDWLKDPALTLCSPSTRGVWIDLLCVMHEMGRTGELAGTIDQLARLARCTTTDIVAAIDDLKTQKAAGVTSCNGVVTLQNRRMQREHKERLATNRRVKKHRSNAAETVLKQPSSYSVSVSSSVSSSPIPPKSVGGLPLDDNQGSEAFNAFWAAYPRRQGKGEAKKAFARAIPKTSLKAVLEAIERQKQGSDWRRDGGQYVPHPATWLNQERWSDEIRSNAVSQGANGSVSQRNQGVIGDLDDYARKARAHIERQAQERAMRNRMAKEASESRCDTPQDPGNGNGGGSPSEPVVLS